MIHYPNNIQLDRDRLMVKFIVQTLMKHLFPNSTNCRKSLTSSLHHLFCPQAALKHSSLHLCIYFITLSTEKGFLINGLFHCEWLFCVLLELHHHTAMQISTLKCAMQRLLNITFPSSYELFISFASSTDKPLWEGKSSPNSLTPCLQGPAYSLYSLQRFSR